LFGKKAFEHSFWDIFQEEDDLDLVAKLYHKKGLYVTAGETGYIAISANSKKEARTAVEQTIVAYECNW